MVADKALTTLRNRGKRMTAVRREIVDIVLSSQSPVSAPQIKDALKSRGKIVNKTTVYRQLSFLIAEHIICEVILTPGITHYESASLSHHHHVTCVKCEETSDVDVDEFERTMPTFVNRIKTRGFVIQDHILEFYGLCAKCQ